MKSPVITSDDLIRFVAHESRLLDEQRLEEWLGLFADEGWYWLPADAAHNRSSGAGIPPL